jgi:hypothetical protein
MINKDMRDAGVGEQSLKLFGMGFASLLTAVLGLVFIGAGLYLGVVESLALGGMVGLSLGFGTFGVAFVLKDDY